MFHITKFSGICVIAQSWVNKLIELKKNTTLIYLPIVSTLFSATPHFDSYPSQSTYELDQGQTLTIPCSAKGNPKPDINWMKDQSPLILKLVCLHKMCFKILLCQIELL